MSTILITGGCGYIGSHVCLEILDQHKDCKIILLDNCSNNSEHTYGKILSLLDAEDANRISFVKGDIRYPESYEFIFYENKIDLVIHLASYKSVPESVENPLKYYDNNVIGLIKLLECMDKHNVRDIIFSSSATVYDNNNGTLSEDAPLKPSNPYGNTKYMMENILRDLYISSDKWNIIILRYFNPVGAHVSFAISDYSKGNLFPIICDKIKKDQPIAIYGNDYNTNDGTCMRDYIHITDLSKFHIKCMSFIHEKKGIYEIFNVGTGKATSVLEVVNMFSEILGKDIEKIYSEKRKGDLPVTICNIDKCRRILKWEPTLSLRDMVHSQMKSMNLI